MIYSLGLVSGLTVFGLSVSPNHDSKIKTRKNSTIHALITSSFATFYLYNTTIHSLWTFILGFSAGYATYELLLAPWLPSLKLDKATILHHIIMAYSTMYYDEYPVILALGYLTEISTIFLNLGYIELKKRGKTMIFYFYAILTLIGFFVFRILMLWTVVGYMYYTNNHLGTAIGSFMGVLNLVWFEKLIKNI